MFAATRAACLGATRIPTADPGGLARVGSAQIAPSLNVANVQTTWTVHLTNRASVASAEGTIRLLVRRNGLPFYGVATLLTDNQCVRWSYPLCSAPHASAQAFRAQELSAIEQPMSVLQPEKHVQSKLKPVTWRTTTILSILSLLVSLASFGTAYKALKHAVDNDRQVSDARMWDEYHKFQSTFESSCVNYGKQKNDVGTTARRSSASRDLQMSLTKDAVKDRLSSSDYRLLAVTYVNCGFHDEAARFARTSIEMARKAATRSETTAVLELSELLDSIDASISIHQQLASTGAEDISEAERLLREDDQLARGSCQNSYEPEHRILCMRKLSSVALRRASFFTMVAQRDALRFDDSCSEVSNNLSEATKDARSGQESLRNDLQYQVTLCAACLVCTPINLGVSRDECTMSCKASQQRQRQSYSARL
jgi:hypothetical protein